MAHPQSGLEQVCAFSYLKWHSILPELAEEYKSGYPSPHIYLTDFLDEDVACAAAQEFPDAAVSGWTHYKHQNENKLGMTKRALFPFFLGRVVDELNSQAFLRWISKLTGIADLVSDRRLDGGGLHQSGRGGFLNLHTDFTAHHYQSNWRRRVNLVLYLTPRWHEDWGGALEFWDSKKRNRVAKYPSLFNHAVIFNTDDRSLHGFPDPLLCPQGVTRNSLALYYYTIEESTKPVARATDYQARPGDGAAKTALIWLDKHAVSLYSRAKKKFGFSDDFVSRILGAVSRSSK